MDELIPVLIVLFWFCTLSWCKASRSGFEDPFISLCETASYSRGILQYCFVRNSTCDLSKCYSRYKVQGAKDTAHFILPESRQRCQPGERSGEPGPGTLQAATSRPVNLHQRANPVRAHLMELQSTPLMLPTVGSICVYEKQYTSVSERLYKSTQNYVVLAIQVHVSLLEVAVLKHGKDLIGITPFVYFCMCHLQY
jgi:hypothetical protein